MRGVSVVALAVLAVVAVGAIVWLALGRPASAPSGDAEPSVAAGVSAETSDSAAGLPPAVASAPPGGEEGEEAGLPGEGPWAADPLAASDDARAAAWASVDLEAVRAAMPDNLYWKLGAPTKDPEVLRERAEERERWNTEYGKVLSNTATEAEVDAFYAREQRLSEDYLAFAVHLLKNYGKGLDQRDIGLLKVAVELHLAKLEEIPRRIADAHERRRAQEAARQAWLADQKAFEGGGEGR